MWKIGVNILAILVLAFAVVYRMNYSGRDQVRDARAMGVRGGEFALQSDQGEVKLSDFRGKTVVLYFGFASCPDVCPMSLSSLNRMLKDFPQRDEVQVVFISVDHQRDTPEGVSKYARYFNEDFVGVTGSKKSIDEVTEKYNIYYKFIELENSEMGYTVDHTSKFIIIDEEGETQKVVHSEEDPEVFLEALSSVVNRE